MPQYGRDRTRPRFIVQAARPVRDADASAALNTSTGRRRPGPLLTTAHR